MLFKGTPTRSAEDIAQQVDSIGGQMDAFTSKEYAGYYMKVLDEHLPLAVEILADSDRIRCSRTMTSRTRRRSMLEEIKMVEDTPDDLVHEIFAEGFWNGHPLGRPILGTPAASSALNRRRSRILRRHLRRLNFVVVAAGNLEHDRRHALLERALAYCRTTARKRIAASSRGDRPDPPERARTEPRGLRHEALPQHHPDRTPPTR